ncbi:hypothetical protein E2C01_065284 [Portunus trituberculatus]|uniref:Uncharacterized protein n=1 Tax=Portunus trituberculatus TaxID=210409 RepID=A0A5B7HP63_PORTR|nr:hypothetical protein [Portunus trituberculatus]
MCPLIHSNKILPLFTPALNTSNILLLVTFEAASNVFLPTRAILVTYSLTRLTPVAFCSVYLATWPGVPQPLTFVRIIPVTEINQARVWSSVMQLAVTETCVSW